MDPSILAKLRAAAEAGSHRSQIALDRLRAAQMAADAGWSAANVAEAVAEATHAAQMADAMVSESGWSAADAAEVAAEAEQFAAAAAAAAADSAGAGAAAGANAASTAVEPGDAPPANNAGVTTNEVADGTAHDEAFRRWLSEGGHTPLDSPVAWAATRPAVGKGIDDIKGKVDDVECKGKGKGIHEAAAA